VVQAKGEEIYRLLQCVEFVQEALIRYERALGDECWAVDEIRGLLKDTVPMLQTDFTSKFGSYASPIIKGRTYDRGAHIHTI
jgi:hypothetical protein